MQATEKILNLLKEKNLKYEFSEHEPTPTSEDSARIRGSPLQEGAKAMLLRSKGKFFMCVLSGDKKIDFSKVKEILGEKSVSFATAEQVLEITGCQIGGVPPFGTIFNIPIYIDNSLKRNENVSFNAGDRKKSIEMKTKDYLEVSEGKLVDFSV
tara:strand:+ start:292 stop:753 length:462 start_codon:yes stop_codon:yes gene_type:complete